METKHNCKKCQGEAKEYQEMAKEYPELAEGCKVTANQYQEECRC